MATTASLKKTSRSGLRSVPNPRPDAAGSLGAEVVAIERNQRIIVPSSRRWRQIAADVEVRPSSSSQ